MNSRCTESYFWKIGVIKGYKANNALDVDFCHPHWIDYWMCQQPDAVESGVWWVVGAFVQLCQCEIQCACGDKQCGYSLYGEPCGSLGGGCPAFSYCSEEAQCEPCALPCQGQTVGTAAPGGQCDCRWCASDDGPLPKLTPEQITANYNLLIYHPKLATILQLTQYQLNQLFAYINDLESELWPDWGYLADPGISKISNSQLESCWLKILALTLYLEHNCVYPWSILNYTDRELRSLLLFHEAYAKNVPQDVFNDKHYGMDYTQCLTENNGSWKPDGYSFHWIWASNPLTAYGMTVGLLGGKDPTSHYEAVDLIWNALNLPYGWKHQPYGTGMHAYCKTKASPLDFFVKPDCAQVLEHGIGNCQTMAQLFRVLLRALNIPAINGYFDTKCQITCGAINLPTIGRFSWRMDFYLPGGQLSGFLPFNEAFSDSLVYYKPIQKGGCFVVHEILRNELKLFLSKWNDDNLASWVKWKVWDALAVSPAWFDSVSKPFPCLGSGCGEGYGALLDDSELSGMLLWLWYVYATEA